MKLTIDLFSLGINGGTVCARLQGPVPMSALDGASYLSIQIGYVIRPNNIWPDFNEEDHIAVRIPGQMDRYAHVTIIWARAVPSSDPTCNPNWPDKSEYKGKLALMTANLIANAELASLDDVVPTVTRRANLG